jgi:hypothetical protein
MKSTQRLVGWAKTGMPWLLALVVSTSLAYLFNAAAIGSLSAATPQSELGSTVDEDARDPCRLDVDGALYATVDWWLPGGRSAYCSARANPALPDRYRDWIVDRLAHAGNLEATITVADLGNIHIELYCANGSQSRQISAHADSTSAAGTHALYERVCVTGRA